MKLWISHPRSKKPDSMLTLAVAGFALSGLIVVSTLAYTFINKHSLEGMSSVAMLIGAVLGPTVAAYTIRKYTEFQQQSQQSKRK